MEIVSFESIDSTHKYLYDKISAKEITSPVLVKAFRQSAGVGSRGNKWVSLEGNLFFSFCIKEEDLPLDLPMSSCSIYFAYILKEILAESGSNVWIKWPNDFYIKDKKIGGVITIVKNGFFICSCGLNTKNHSEEFGKLDIDIDDLSLLKQYIKLLKKTPSWKQIFSKYSVEFELSKRFHANVKNKKTSLKNASLCSDGSLLLGDERIYALR